MATSREMTEGRALPLIFNFTLPLLLGNLLQQTYSLVDAAIVGKFLGINALASVGASTSVIFLILGFCNGCCGGFGIPVAQKFGARDYITMRRYVAVSLQLAAVMSVVLAVVTSICCADILRMMRTPDNIFTGAYYYLLVTFIGVPCTFFYNLLSSIIRALGDSKTPFWFLLIVVILDMALNPLFIFGWGPIPSLGVFGVSLSTSLSKGIGLLIIFVLFKTQLPVKLSWQYLRPFPWQTLKGLLHISVPSGGETLSYQLSQTTIMKMVNVFGLVVINTKVYAYIVAMFCYMYTIALANAAQIIVGFLVGADREEEISRRVWRTMWFGMAISIALATTFYIFSDHIFSIFTDDPEVLKLGHTILLIEIFLEIGRSVNIIMVQCLQAAGDIRTPMFVGIFGMWLCAVNLAYILGIHLGWGLVGIWIAMAIDECVRALIFVWRWHSGKWKNRKLIAPA